jgi:hypothetical protein
MKQLRGPDGRFIYHDAALSAWMRHTLKHRGTLEGPRQCLREVDRFLLMEQTRRLRRTTDAIEIDIDYYTEGESPIGSCLRTVERIEKMRRIIQNAAKEIEKAWNS